MQNGATNHFIHKRKSKTIPDSFVESERTQEAVMYSNANQHAIQLYDGTVYWFFGYNAKRALDYIQMIGAKAFKERCESAVKKLDEFKKDNQ